MIKLNYFLIFILLPIGLVADDSAFNKALDETIKKNEVTNTKKNTIEVYNVMFEPNGPKALKITVEFYEKHKDDFALDAHLINDVAKFVKYIEALDADTQNKIDRTPLDVFKYGFNEYTVFGVAEKAKDLGITKFPAIVLILNKKKPIILQGIDEINKLDRIYWDNAL